MGFHNMIWLYFTVLLFSSRTLSDSYYNYNGHSYNYMSYSHYVNWMDWYCSWNSMYIVDINDEGENTALASIMRKDRAIGVYKGDDDKYYSMHTNKIITYSNWGSSTSPMSLERVKLTINGYWNRMSRWGYAYIICEKDSTSSKGVNITKDKILNINYDYLLTFRGHSYYVYDVPRDYQTGMKICKNDNNAYLFVPNGGIENCAIHGYSTGYSYVGITLQNWEFYTDKGYPTDYLPWGPNNPKKNQNCVRRDSSGSFYSARCTDNNKIICETDSVVSGAIPVNCSAEHQKYYYAQVFYYQNYTFYVFDIVLLRKEAQSLCEDRDEVLYVPISQDENCAVMENTFYSIGLNYGQIHVKHLFVRGDDRENNYTNWETNYPLDHNSKPCVYCAFESGKWLNDDCTKETFICRGKASEQRPSNINCTHDYYQTPDEGYSIQINSLTYTLFGYPMTFHDSTRLCSYYGQDLIQTTDGYVIKQINDNLQNTNFYMDYRILWNDTKLTWLGSSPANTPNWAPGEPKNNDFEISCVSVAANGTWITNTCKTKYVTVCVGDNYPTGTSSNTESTTTTTTTSTTTTTTPGQTNPSTTATQSTNASNVASSKKSNSVALGVGLFFAIAAVIGAVIGVFYYKRKNPFNMNPLKSFGSFRTKGTLG